MLAFTLNLIDLKLALLDLKVEVFDLVFVVYCLVVLIQLLCDHNLNVKPLHGKLLFTQFRFMFLKLLILQNLLIFPKENLFLAFNDKFFKLTLRSHLLGNEIFVNILDPIEISHTFLS